MKPGTAKVIVTFDGRTKEFTFNISEKTETPVAPTDDVEQEQPDGEIEASNTGLKSVSAITALLGVIAAIFAAVYASKKLSNKM